MRSQGAALIAGVTFATFMVEAIGHYNMGYRSITGEKGRWKMPPRKEMLHLAGIVGIASLINATIVKQVSGWAENRYGE